MRGLFFRIFIPVVLTVSISFIVGVYAAWLLLPRPEFGNRGVLPPAVALPAPPTRPLAPGPLDGDAQRPALFRLAMTLEREVAADVTAGDIDGACRRIRDLPPDRGVRAYLASPDGGVACGPAPPGELAELGRKASEDGGRMVHDGRGNVRIARPIAAPDGRRLLLLLEVTPPRGPWWRAMIFPAFQFVVVSTGLSVVCFLLTRFIAGPVLKLRSAVRRFAEGDLEQRIGPSFGRRQDALAELGRDFDAMAARIASLLSSQRRLLQDISHELRSPLARQAVAIELVRRSAGPEATDHIERVSRELDRMNALVGELLTLTRLEAGTPTTAPAPVPLDELLRLIVDDARFELSDSDKRIDLSIAGPVSTTGVAELLRRAIENVLRNAVRYTRPATAIDVALAAEGDDAVVRIRDHGPGVPDAELSEIFRPFYRVAAGRERQSGGVGLGLAIAQRAVATHGGSISARNVADGGLLVEIRLPLATGRDLSPGKEL